MYRVKNVLIIVFEILVSSTPLTHSFSFRFIHWPGTKCVSFLRGSFCPTVFHIYFLRLLAMRLYISWEGRPRGLYKACVLAPSGST